MALTKEVTIKKVYIYDIEKNDIIEKEIKYPNAYIQITGISGNKDNIKVKITAFENDKKENVLLEQSYEFKPNVEQDSENFIMQGYKFLKTLEEFKEVIDC